MYPRMFLDVSMKMSTSFSYFANAIVMRCCQRGEWCKVQSRAEIIKLRYLITYFLFTKFTYFTFTTFLPTPVVVIILIVALYDFTLCRYVPKVFNLFLL